MTLIAKSERQTRRTLEGLMDRNNVVWLIVGVLLIIALLIWIIGRAG